MKNILVIGAGSIGERHIRCFQATGRARIAVCETNDGLRNRICSEYGLKTDFPSLEEACHHKWDAAVICTPAHLHIPMALQLAERGVGLLIEKPLSTFTEHVADLLHLAAKRRVSAGVAYVLRHHPALLAMKHAIDSSRFGDPVQIGYTGGQHFPFYRPAYREIYYTRHDTGGGAIQDGLTHMINAAEWLVGPVTKLAADADHCVLPGVEVEDTVHVITRHGSIMGSFCMNQHQPPNETTLTVICRSGAVRYEGHRNRWLSCAKPGEEWVLEGEFDLQRDDLFVAQASAFLGQLEGTAPAACSLEEALQTLKASLAALQSARTGQWVQL